MRLTELPPHFLLKIVELAIKVILNTLANTLVIAINRAQYT